MKTLPCGAVPYRIKEGIPQIALVRTAKEAWRLPQYVKGSTDNALIKLWQETGFSKDPFSEVYPLDIEYKNTKGQLKQVQFFLITVIQDNRDKSKIGAWFTLNEARKKTTFASSKKVIDQLKSFIFTTDASGRSMTNIAKYKVPEIQQIENSLNELNSAFNSLIKRVERSNTLES
jgi:hypothetical protein